MTELPPLPENNLALDKAIAETGELAEVIRDLSKGQVDQWRQLPLLGLMRSGNRGLTLPSDALLYKRGLYGVNFTNPPHDILGTFVDCASGDILYLDERDLGIQGPASDKSVIYAWLSHVRSDGFNASEIVARLKRDAMNQHPPEKTTLKAHLEVLTPRRLKTAKELGLRALYSRDSSLPGTELDVDTYSAITSIDPFFVS